MKEPLEKKLFSSQMIFVTRDLIYLFIYFFVYLFIYFFVYLFIYFWLYEKVTGKHLKWIKQYIPKTNDSYRIKTNGLCRYQI